MIGGDCTTKSEILIFYRRVAAASLDHDDEDMGEEAFHRYRCPKEEE